MYFRRLNTVANIFGGSFLAQAIEGHPVSNAGTTVGAIQMVPMVWAVFEGTATLSHRKDRHDDRST
jgi:hypothetical protein